MNNIIANIFGGPSPEHDISILTGLQASRILSSNYDLKNIYWSKDNRFYLVENELESKDFLDNKSIYKKELQLNISSNSGFYLKKKRIDFQAIINSCHGGPGEDGTLQAIFDITGFKYTGSSLTTSKIGMDKYAFYLLMKENGLKVLDKILYNSSLKPEMKGPFIIKPRFGGSSIGVEVVDNFDSIDRIIKNSNLYNQGTVVEKFLPNSIDLLVAVRNYPKFEHSEIEKPTRSTNLEMFSYRDKYLGNGGLEGSKRELPAQISKTVEEKIELELNKLNEILNIQGIARVDFLLQDNELYINEINTIPGSHALYLWSNLGKSKFELLNDMIDEALSKKTIWSTEGSDGLALKSAKDIQSKLG